LEALKGVGLASIQWEQDRPGAYHIRRRLTEAEVQIVGDVVDLRGTAEGAERLKLALPHLPEIAIGMAYEEVDLKIY
jgi:hypothetical protein